ncbi:hypothetical protein J3459_006094 [Metarhizium acridum]|nr:hypothetical protein J3459_006094 [Metarhizium acridum]
MQNGVKADSRQSTHRQSCTMQQDRHIPSMTASRLRTFNSVRSLLRSFLPYLARSLATPNKSGHTCYACRSTHLTTNKSQPPTSSSASFARDVSANSFPVEAELPNTTTAT